MKVRYIVYITLICLLVASCAKNNVSKIPQISFVSLTPPVFKVSKDTPILIFHFADGDADLGNDPSSAQKDIYIMDSRFPPLYVGYSFPQIDQSILDPKKGIEGDCTFEFLPSLIGIRDTILHPLYDTMSFSCFIVDKAGNHSDTITTPSIIMRLK